MRQIRMELVQLAQALFLWSWQSVPCEEQQGVACRSPSPPSHEPPSSSSRSPSLDGGSHLGNESDAHAQCEHWCAWGWYDSWKICVEHNNNSVVHCHWLYIRLPNLLVEDNTNSSFGHVEHTPSLPMVKLVRHSLLKCTITLYTTQSKVSAKKII